ncbi:MAG: hypothetical protein Q9219_004268 [cf. Caloplaca sp. 3 TL-2023]
MEPFMHAFPWRGLLNTQDTKACSMAVRGQRFHINLDDDQTTSSQQSPPTSLSSRNPWTLVTDIQERSPTSAAVPPSPPRIKSSQTGFPAHKKRADRSKFKQRSSQTRDRDGVGYPPTPQTGGLETTSLENTADGLDERDNIDMENRQRIARMSSEDIDQARKELMSGLSESLIERLLKKANIDEPSVGAADGKNSSKKLPSNKKVTFEAKVSEATITQQQSQEDASDSKPENPKTEPPNDQPVPSTSGYPAIPSFHFPQPPTPPSLDPEDPDFLSKLHSTYFPSLPANPNALSWMQPPDPAENEAYSPTRDNLPPSAVRFDFKGRLLPPRLAAQIPPTKGLHHHGTAPEAAGYTIPELAHLSRSSFPAQRCIAYQTLGRILYRLGTGIFGPEDHELCQGLWKCIDQGRVLDTLTTEAARDGQSGNRSCWVIATEAVWLWRKGGGRKWKAT